MPDPISLRWAHPAVILVATDLSDLDRLMPFALEQASESGARLVLIHVLASSAVLSADVAGMPYYDTSGVLESADKSLLPWCEFARRKGVACDALVREGNAAWQIAAAARQFKADRIVLGTRGRGKLSKLLLGSVAEQVLRSANLPVITVGPEARLPVDYGEKRVVVYATTLRETSRASAALACRIAASQMATLLLLHVLPPADEMETKGMPTGMDSAAMRALRALAADVAAECGAAVEPVVMHGNPSIEILATASERDAGLIVLAATHRSSFENLTRDRTVYRVLAHARCPVLTLRESATQSSEAVAAADAEMQHH